MKKYFSLLKIAIIYLFAPIVLTYRDRIAEFLERSFTLSIILPPISASFYPASTNYSVKIFQSTTKDNVDKQVNDYISTINPALLNVMNHVSDCAEPGNDLFTVLLVIRSVTQN